MLNLLEDQLLNNVVSRAEQSRCSYALQTEEFRTLNSNLQIYLNDIKIIDNENNQLQKNIDEIRTNYIQTLENHLKRLPEDFRQEGQTLTEAHIERYKSKSRAKRFLNEREELKKRINFLVHNEKIQTKRLNSLQKQERLVENEFKTLNDQLQNLYNYLQIEKQTHQQAMNKVDDLQLQLEQICIERSKTEFQIQTLREEVKLMETTKEFLDEEHQTILLTQSEANDYFLSHLNDSISRIREDFNELNKNQLKYIENGYKQMINTLEENSPDDEDLLNQQRTKQIEYEKLQDEYQTIKNELTTLNNHNQTLSERILNMETDLYTIQNEHMNDLLIKDNEFEQNQNELQILNDKLNNLAEYDRNLKFELTLYRGVLENEYRRKQQQQQQQQQTINNQLPLRPTTLQPTTTIITIRNKKNSLGLTNRNQLEPIVEKNNIQNDEEKNVNKQDDENAVEQEQEQVSTEAPNSTFPQDQSSSSVDAQQLPKISPTNQEELLTNDRLEPSNISIPSNDSTLPEDQPIPSPINEETILTSIPQISSEETEEVSQIETEKFLDNSTATEEPCESSGIEETSITPSKDKQIPLQTDISSTSPVNTAPTEDLSSSTLPDNPQTTSNIQELSNISSNEQLVLSESSNIPYQEDQSISSDVQQMVITSSQDQSSSSIPIDENPTSTIVSEEIENDNQFTKSENDELVNDPSLSNQSIEPSLAQEFETNENEEPISSSNLNSYEKDSIIGFTSSPGYYGPINDSSHLNNKPLADTEDISTDLVGEVDTITSPKFEDNNESNLAAVMQDLRYVYRTLINNDDLIEINDDFSDNLIDRLEFGDNLIRTLFDNFLRKYLLQAVKLEKRSKLFDWIEFRDILFPIVTGRYMEEHIRKLFDLFDRDNNGYLSSEQTIELLELLQVNNSNELVPNKDLTIDEIIEIIQETENMLSEEIKTKQWYIQLPSEEENIDSSEAPVANTINRMILLSRIFKRIGADYENKQVDIKKPMLSMKLTNEFIHNNIPISNDDLELFIELYLNRKENSNGFINWIEFRDIFFPIVSDGMVSRVDIERWFDILDKDRNQTISQEQILHFLRLLQLENPEEIFEKIQDIYPNSTDVWTLGELIFCLESVDETTIHILPTNNQLSTFDLEWFTKNTC